MTQIFVDNGRLAKCRYPDLNPDRPQAEMRKSW